MMTVSTTTGSASLAPAGLVAPAGVLDPAGMLAPVPVGSPSGAVSGAPASTRRFRRRARLANLPAGARTHNRRVQFVIGCDESGSTGSTDPRMARRHDISKHALPWLARNLPDDLVAVACFDDEAAVLVGPLAARDLPGNFNGYRIAGRGGTRFVPVVQEAVRVAHEHPEAHTVAVIVTDGWGGDVDAADALLGQHGLTGVLVPFGPQSPPFSAQRLAPGAQHHHRRPRRPDGARHCDDARSDRDEGRRPRLRRLIERTRA